MRAVLPLSGAKPLLDFARMKPPLPQQLIRRWHAWLVVWRVHHWLGLAMGAFIVLASFTGSVLVIHHDVEKWLQPERHRVAPPQPGEPAATDAAEIVRTLAAQAPAGYRPLRIEPAKSPQSADKYVFIGATTADRWSALVDPHRGNVLWQGADQSLFTPWLLHLHMHLHLGAIGYLTMGLAGLALTLLAVSGIILTRGRLRVLLRAPIRWGQGWRAATADLHCWLGLVGIYFSFVLGVTGVWFSILITPGQLKRSEAALPPPFELGQLTAIAPALAAAQARWPDAEVARITLPWKPEIGLQVRMLHRDAPVWRKFSHVDFDPVTGQMQRVRDAREATPGEKLRAILAPLHFGFYGATLTKWLYAIGGLVPGLLALSGTLIWWLRRRGSVNRPISTLS